MKSSMPSGSVQGDLRRRYRRMRPGWQPAATVFREIVRAAAPSSGRVLDVGAGRKDFPLDDAPSGLTLFGVDPDASAIAHHDSLTFRAAASGERLPFPDASFDLICSAWVLEHVDAPRAFMREIARVLRPGGAFAFVTPNGRNPVTWVIRAIPNRLHPTIMRRVQRRDVRDTYPVRYRINTPRTVDRIMGGAGLHREQLVLNGDPTYLALGLRSFRAWAALERVFDLPGMSGARVHLVGLYRKA
ncbi:MAG TPA: class I SAM-dependent methyltransferase [Actinomycetota bacterium]|nr:class I SAM-dependent methyltransferase [Actinomycetota bacterium]